MIELDEETSLAILFSNTKRKKRNDDLVTIAKCCKFLVNLYGSNKAVGKKVGLSGEMIREFLTVLNLPIEIQEMISNREIDSVDIVRQIATIKDSEKQKLVAKELANDLTHDVRDVKRLVKNTDIKVDDAKKRIMDAKPKGLHIVLIDFNDITYNNLKNQSKIRNTKPADLVRNVIIEWLENLDGG